MLQFKHPQRFNALGCSRWFGVMYGDGAVGLPLASPAIYHGRFGTGLFQIVYRTGLHSNWVYLTLLEWHLLAGLILLLAVAWPPLAWISAGMWLATLAAALRAVARAPLESGAPWWCRPLIFGLYIAQPVVRSYHRYLYRITHRRLPPVAVAEGEVRRAKRISVRSRDWYFRSDRNLGREDLLGALVDATRELRWSGDFDSEWQAHDLELLGDAWHKFRISTSTEELGWPRRFTRVRCVLKLSRFACKLMGVLAVMTTALALSPMAVAALPAYVGMVAVVSAVLLSRRRCWKAIDYLVARAGQTAGLEGVREAIEAPVRSPHAQMEDGLAPCVLAE
jgi:hypothetical protein